MNKPIPNRLLIVTYLLLMLQLFTACSKSKDRIIVNTDPVYITTRKIVLTPSQPLKVEGRFSQLCFEIPDGFKQDKSSWSLLSKDGTRTAPYATLTTTKGTEREFYQRSFLENSKKYICLSSDIPVSQDINFKQITVWANLPFWTEEIIWLSADRI